MRDNSNAPDNDFRIDPLEDRRYFAVSTNTNGWTVVTPAADSRLVYVSSSGGSDSNNGLSAGSPVKTISKGYSLLRDGYADQLLLKRGDTFGSLGDWRKKGRSASEPMLISAYGSGARPQINSGSSYGIITYGSGGSSGRSIDNLYIMSLSFTPHTYNHSNGNMDTAGIRLLCQGQNILIEDCKIAGYKENIDLAAGDKGLRNVTIRRNQIIDAHADPKIGHAHGLWIGGATNGVTIEENIIDHNGWRQGKESDRTFYNHNVYVYKGTNVVIKNNVISRGSFYGIKMNSGGTVKGNFFARNAESIYLENTATIENNVITEAVSMPTQNWGVGINTQKAPSATIKGNLITKVLTSDASGVAGIQLFNSGAAFNGVVENNIVYNWRNGILAATKGNGAGSVVIRNNQLQMTDSSSAAMSQSSSAAQSTFVYSGNVYASGSNSKVNKIKGTTQSLADWKSKTGESNAEYRTIKYPDASRDIAKYATSRGLTGSFEGYINAARGMDKGNWNAALAAAAVNAWFFQGFGVGAAPSAPTAPTAVSGVFVDDTSPHKVEITFSKSLSVAPDKSKLLVKNLDDGTTHKVDSTKLLTDGKTVRFRFGGSLPQGNYRATYDTLKIDFHVLVGDANRDRIVNATDFSKLAGAFGAEGKTFKDGDFNYDGAVSSKDFNIMLTNYGQQLKVSSAPLSFGIESPFSEDSVTAEDESLTL